MMKESEFCRRLSESLTVVNTAVRLAKEAGATFEPEMTRIPPLYYYAGSGRILSEDGGSLLPRDLTTAESLEVLRRCKAVEEAVGHLRSKGYIRLPNDEELLAILEGRQ